MRKAALAIVAIMLVGLGGVLAYAHFSKDTRPWSAERRLAAQTACHDKFGQPAQREALRDCLQIIPVDGDWFRYR